MAHPIVIRLFLNEPEPVAHFCVMRSILRAAKNTGPLPGQHSLPMDEGKNARSSGNPPITDESLHRSPDKETDAPPVGDNGTYVFLDAAPRRSAEAVYRGLGLGHSAII